MPDSHVKDWSNVLDQSFTGLSGIIIIQSSHCDIAGSSWYALYKFIPLCIHTGCCFIQTKERERSASTAALRH